jgi:hypothetical protein
MCRIDMLVLVLILVPLKIAVAWRVMCLTPRLF